MLCSIITGVYVSCYTRTKDQTCAKAFSAANAAPTARAKVKEDLFMRCFIVPSLDTGPFRQFSFPGVNSSSFGFPPKNCTHTHPHTRRIQYFAGFSDAAGRMQPRLGKAPMTSIE